MREDVGKQDGLRPIVGDEVDHTLARVIKHQDYHDDMRKHLNAAVKAIQREENGSINKWQNHMLEELLYNHEVMWIASEENTEGVSIADIAVRSPSDI